MSQTIEMLKCFKYTKTHLLFINFDKYFHPHIITSIYKCFTTNSLNLLQDITNHLDKLKIPYIYNSNDMTVPVQLAHCPLCATKGINHPSRYTFRISSKGNYFCYKCQSRGHWSDDSLIQNLEHGISQSVLNAKNDAIEWSSVKLDMEKSWFINRGISVELLRKMQVYPLNASKDGFINLSFHEYSPIINHKNESLNVTFEKVSSHEISININNMSNQTHGTTRSGHNRGVFGLTSISFLEKCPVIVITDNELDALAISEYTKFPCISVPYGESKLPLNVVTFLQKHDGKFYLWIKDKYMEEQISQQLGRGRCFVVRIDCNSETLLTPWEAKERCRNVLDKSIQPLPHSKISGFSKFKDLVRDEFVHHKRLQGIQSLTLPALNKILKGNRPGELTIITGPTGSGKTSILSQLSLDYCSQGLGTLWGSFEITNQKLIKKMIRQYADIDFSRDMSRFEEWSEKFRKLPMHFMDFFGSCPLEEVLEAMQFTVDANNVQHIVLDNLQFMLSGQERGNFDKWDLMDKSVAKLRQFATSRNVHISLVIHPRKENDDTILGVASVTGTSKATQEADNVIIIQKIGKKRFLEIKKNRFDGELGRIHYKYDPISTKIYEIRDQDITTQNIAPQDELYNDDEFEELSVNLSR